MRLSIFIVLLFISTGNVYCQPRSSLLKDDHLVGQTVILFRVGSHKIDSNYMDNRNALASIDKIFNSLGDISIVNAIIIKATSSPEGHPDFNNRLARLRAKAVYQYLYARYPALIKDLNKDEVTTDTSIDWEGLKEKMQADSLVPARQALMELIDNPHVSELEKSRSMAKMEGGKTLTYLRRKILPRLRTASITLIFYTRESKPDPLLPITAPEQIPALDVPTTEFIMHKPTSPASHALGKTPYTISPRRNFSFALRTNLLSDIVLAPNIGIELPFGNHFSVAADFTYAYWRSNNRYALQTIQGNIEGRYWFGWREQALTGWNVGVYATFGGRYDVQWKGGWQGDRFWTAGLLGGFSFSIAPQFNLDLALGAGYFFTPEARHYERPQDGHLIWRETRYDVGRFSLTKARVGLVWLINTNKTSKK